MSPAGKRAKVCALAVDKPDNRLRAAFPSCQHVRRFLIAFFPVNRCRRVGALVVFLFSVVAIQHSSAHTPYLRAVGPVELRFQKRVAYVPPKKLPSSAGGEPAPPETPVLPEVPLTVIDTRQPVIEKPPEKPVQVPPPPPADLKPIVPDAFAPRLLPEEVLPYFITPESLGEKSVSTATLKQK